MLLEGRHGQGNGVIEAQWQRPDACPARVAGHLARGLAVARNTGCFAALRMTPLAAYAVRLAMRMPVRLPCLPSASM